MARASGRRLTNNSAVHDEVEIVAVNDPFIEPEYAVSWFSALRFKRIERVLPKYLLLAIVLTSPPRPTC
jgi:hypothetical protein